MTGTFFQPMPIGGGKTSPARDKAFALGRVTVGHWSNGKMNHEWLHGDDGDLMKQIGLGHSAERLLRGDSPAQEIRRLCSKMRGPDLDGLTVLADGTMDVNLAFAPCAPPIFPAYPNPDAPSRQCWRKQPPARHPGNQHPSQDCGGLNRRIPQYWHVVGGLCLAAEHNLHGLCDGFFALPDLGRMKTVSCGWGPTPCATNAGGALLRCGAVQCFFCVRRGQGARFKYSPNVPSTRAPDAVGFKSQNIENLLPRCFMAISIQRLPSGRLSAILALTSCRWRGSDRYGQGCRTHAAQARTTERPAANPATAQDTPSSNRSMVQQKAPAAAMPRRPITGGDRDETLQIAGGDRAAEQDRRRPPGLRGGPTG